jgi:hypothetical protein
MNKTERDNDLKIALSTLDQVAGWAGADNPQDRGLLVVSVMHTSKSNLSFSLDLRFYIPTLAGVDSLYLNWAYAQLMNARQDKHGLVKWHGLGIDRAFEVANNLERLISKHLDQSVKIQYRGIY